MEIYNFTYVINFAIYNSFNMALQKKYTYNVFYQRQSVKQNIQQLPDYKLIQQTN
jgi:hypothetical protein